MLRDVCKEHTQLQQLYRSNQPPRLSARSFAWTRRQFLPEARTRTDSEGQVDATVDVELALIIEPSLWLEERHIGGAPLLALGRFGARGRRTDRVKFASFGYDGP